MRLAPGSYSEPAGRRRVAAAIYRPPRRALRRAPPSRAHRSVPHPSTLHSVSPSFFRAVIAGPARLRALSTATLKRNRSKHSIIARSARTVKENRENNDFAGDSRIDSRLELAPSTGPAATPRTAFHGCRAGDRRNAAPGRAARGDGGPAGGGEGL